MSGRAWSTSTWAPIGGGRGGRGWSSWDGDTNGSGRGRGRGWAEEPGRGGKSEQWADSGHNAWKGSRSPIGEEKRPPVSDWKWHKARDESGESASKSAALDSSEDVEAAKVALVHLIPKLDKAPLEALEEQLRHKRHRVENLDGLEPKAVQDLQCVLDRDLWEEHPCGDKWIREWIKDGVRWALEKELPEEAQENWCHVCWRNFSDQWSLEAHSQTSNHTKKFRSWHWRHGAKPPKGPATPGAASSAASPSPPNTETRGSDEYKVSLLNDRAVEKKKSRYTKMKPPEMIAWVEDQLCTEAAQAKRNLLEYRNRLSEAERQDVLRRIGLPRANDISGVEALKDIFSDEVFAWIQQVPDPEWIYREPTFSWLTGFYWHPESTSLSHGGLPHGAHFCHLCECELYDEQTSRSHGTTRRHAENLVAWVERMGALPPPAECCRCPGATSSSIGAGDGVSGPMIDLEVRRAGDDCPEVPDELDPPDGFTSTHRIPDSRLWDSVPYVAFVVSPPALASHSNGCEWSRRGSKRGSGSWKDELREVRINSAKLKIGPKDKKGGWYIMLQAPVESQGAPREWRSLAMPLRGSGVSEGSTLEFWLQGKWSDSDDLVNLGTVHVRVPSCGSVTEVSTQLPARDEAWQKHKRVADLSDATVREMPLREFVGDAQLHALGGIEALRGHQRAVQFATEDILMSTLVYFPTVQGPAPLLIFLHGDMVREAPNCPMPGLADFCDIYGPAELVKNEKKWSHPCREFVVATPSCSGDYWWFRYPASHDTKAYALPVENWFRGFVKWTQDLDLTSRKASPEGGVRLAGQSMGGYAVLELARAMPDLVAAVAAGAPCFDACRLDWLARRLVNVPVWLLIGRHDSMCSFEECATLALKLKENNAKCVRLSSQGIKGHNEACTRLEKPWLYRWLKDPLADVTF